MKKITSKEAKVQFNGYHSQILGNIKACFKKARILPLEDLKCEDPSFLNIAKQLEIFHKLMEALNDNFFDEEDKIGKSELDLISRYVNLLERLGMAIDSENIEEMTEVVAILAEEPYI